MPTSVGRGTVAMPSVRRFKQQIHGQVIRDVGRRAKFLRIQLTDLELLVHLRMSGDLALKNGNVPPEKHDRLILSLQQIPASGKKISDNAGAGSSLVFNDTRKFGRVWLTANSEEITGRLGPEPLGAEFTPQWLSDAFEQTPSPAQAAPA